MLNAVLYKRPFLSNDNCLILLQVRCMKPNLPSPDQVPVASLVGLRKLGGIVPQEKGRWWAFGKVRPIGCLHLNDSTKERKELRGQGAGKRVQSIRLNEREKQNEIRIWPKKKQHYGYHDRSPSIKKNISKSLWVSRAFKHLKYAGVVNDIAFLIENDDSFSKTKLLKFFFPKKSRSNGPTSHLLKNTLPVVRSSLNYLVM
ncbi:hypothetical protein M9H77_13305 [Catharanthus roseus]|uniref:Uncharacterized protein n=1 Tax=Catharanthus roseus TaxID=4058 RepID=A0ACC0BK39_CATRO|nr:hypothetical protein M9H77_13305 [Catharanthus roseus]